MTGRELPLDREQMERDLRRGDILKIILHGGGVFIGTFSSWSTEAPRYLTLAAGGFHPDPGKFIGGRGVYQLSLHGDNSHFTAGPEEKAYAYEVIGRIECS